jgi:hypothetical protein
VVGTAFGPNATGAIVLATLPLARSAASRTTAISLFWLRTT